MIYEIRIPHERTVNDERLHEQLAEELGAAFGGLTTSQDTIRVHLHRPQQPGDLEAVHGVLLRHDPTEPSRRQQAARAAAAQLHRLRRDDVMLGDDDLSALSPPVKRLARKLMRLEAELRRRGLVVDVPDDESPADNL